jgi:amino acid transporter
MNTTLSRTPATTTATESSELTLKRTLKLRDLVIYGIVLIQPTAALPLFGVVSQEARGHVVTTLLIAMIAMLFTAISYGRMARAYPSAGSAFTYVGRELDLRLGYLVGWSMVMDYLLCPILCVIWCSKAAGNILPQVPYLGWVLFFVTLFTGLNLRGIKASSRTNACLAGAMTAVVGILFACIGRYLWMNATGADLAFFMRPFYDPETFSLPLLWVGTSIAVLTYIGFDAISTLSEEVENPRRNILLATVLTCLFTGLFSGLQIYAGQLVWPYGSASFPDVDTAYVFVAGKAGGTWLLQLVNFTLLTASVGSGMGAQLASARLLYSMGRDEVIPKRFFGVLNPRTQTPTNNVLLTGGLALVGAFVLSYQLSAEMMNFGAFIAFMGVNMAALIHYVVRGGDRRIIMWLPPVLGCVICFYIWLHLRWPAKVLGSTWLLGGLLWGALSKGGFRTMRDVR